MPGYPGIPFPKRPFFSCEETRLLILDQSLMGSMLTGGSVEPWIQLVVAPGNVLDSPPIAILEHSGTVIRIRCRDAIVELDLVDETARKTLPDGSSFLSLGGLAEGNEGRGWIAIA